MNISVPANAVCNDKNILLILLIHYNSTQDVLNSMKIGYKNLSCYAQGRRGRWRRLNVSYEGSRPRALEH